MFRRWLLMAGLWLVLTGADSGSWLAGALATAAAAALSARLLPPAGTPIRPLPALRLVLAFARGSIAGGVDVARRALHPRMPLQPGWVRHPLRLAPGAHRLWFGDLVSLMPGSLGAGDDGQRMLVHCLDTGRHPEAALARHESRLCEVLEGGANRAPHG